MSVGEFPRSKTDTSGMSGIPCNARQKKNTGGKKRPRAYRGKKRGEEFVIWKKKVLVGWKNKMLVGIKTCRLKNKMSVGEFPLPKTDMSGMSGIPCNARPKNGRGGKTRPRAYRGKEEGETIVIWKKKVFCWLGKNKMLVGKKTFQLKNKMWVGEFPLPKTDMSGMSGIPCNARPKNGRGGKTRPRAYRGGRGRETSFGKKRFFYPLEKQNVGGKKTCRLKKNVGWRISPAKKGHVRNVRNSL